MLALYHEKLVTSRLLESLLDIDLDESGAIDDGEEGVTGQVFFIK